VRLLADGHFDRVESERAYYERREAEPTPLSDRVLDWPLETIDGRRVRLRDYAGQVVVVGFWSASDPGLVDELNSLNRRYRNGPVRILGFPGVWQPKTPEAAAAIRMMAKQRQVEFPLLRDDEGTFEHEVSEYEKFGFGSSPAHFVISHDGRIVKRVRGGGAEEAAALRQAVEAAVAAAPKSPTRSP
jgi:peroxiredoxin